MKQTGADALAAMVQSFFANHLRRILGASENTIKAYRDGIRIFLLFLANHVGRSVKDLTLDDINAVTVLAFLNHLDSARDNSVTTRNCRLAAIRSFVEHLLRHDITRAQAYGRILSIPAKRTVHRLVHYIEPEGVRSILAAIDGTDSCSRRDRALLLFLYNTGARISEALAIRPRDLQLERPRQVRLFGKGGKERICPLWTETAAVLKALPLAADSDERIFRNKRGAALTRDGAAYILAKYVGRAAKTHADLRRHSVTPHILRHSCAVALLQAGVDVTVIRDYLGHASIATTSRYLTTNLAMKRDVLQKFWKKAGLERQTTTRWRPSPKILDFLSSM